MFGNTDQQAAQDLRTCCDPDTERLAWPEECLRWEGIGRQTMGCCTNRWQKQKAHWTSRTFNIGYVVFVFIDQSTNQSINQSDRIESNQINQSIISIKSIEQSIGQSIDDWSIDPSIKQSNNIYFRISIIDSYIFYKYRKREREGERKRKIVQIIPVPNT
jgi:hypothetical protein